MIKKTIKTRYIRNYKKIINELIEFTEGGYFKSHRWNLHKKLKKEYLKKKDITFVNHGKGWVHYLHQFDLGLGRKNRKDVKKISKITIVYLELHERKIIWKTREID